MQSKLVQICAIHNNPFSIGWIDGVEEDMMLLVVSLDVRALQFIKNPTTKVVALVNSLLGDRAGRYIKMYSAM